jgi:hypothetical protein
LVIPVVVIVEVIDVSVGVSHLNSEVDVILIGHVLLCLFDHLSEEEVLRSYREPEVSGRSCNQQLEFLSTDC